MLFDVDDHMEQYEGVIATYNINGKYRIYFPCDNETIETTLDDEDLEFVDQLTFSYTPDPHLYTTTRSIILIQCNAVSL